MLAAYLCFNPFLFIKDNRLFISSEGFSTLEKKTPWYVIRRQCCPSSRVWQPSADSKWQFGIRFFLIQTFWVRRDSPLLTKMVRQKAITICREMSHLARSVSRIVCGGQQRPKGRKGTLRPDFQANTRPKVFLANVTTRYRKTVVRKSRYS